MQVLCDAVEPAAGLGPDPNSGWIPIRAGIPEGNASVLPDIGSEITFVTSYQLQHRSCMCCRASGAGGAGSQPGWRRHWTCLYISLLHHSTILDRFAEPAADIGPDSTPEGGASVRPDIGPDCGRIVGANFEPAIGPVSTFLHAMDIYCDGHVSVSRRLFWSCIAHKWETLPRGLQLPAQR